MLGFLILGKTKGCHRFAIGWLVGASFFFYGWWNPSYLGLILLSIVFNYSIGTSLENKSSKPLLVTGITINIGIIGYFKYTNFLIENMNHAFSANINHQQIILPLAISFFTFQQIAYLIDAYRGLTNNNSFLNYCLFVTFFPQLIAGPIVHHKEMLPQFSENNIFKFNTDKFAIGLSIFILGLFKKTVIADDLASYATPLFDISTLHGTLTFTEAWIAALSYTFQLYFDFSGYSDMAIGLGLIFGITLPINFNSPYKSTSIIDFWRRWHITLSYFMRDYVYIPLGGGQKGTVRTLLNLVITMLLGGLWHGAAWTFVIWGCLHGIYLVINHAWRKFSNNYLHEHKNSFTEHLSWTLTFISIVIAWVLFRSSSIEVATNILSSMSGYNGLDFAVSSGKNFHIILILTICLVIVKFLPNSNEIFKYYKYYKTNTITSHSKPTIRILWKPNFTWSFIFSMFFLSSLYTIITDGYHEFIYRFF